MVLRFPFVPAPVVVAPHPVASASVRLRIFTEPQQGATYDQLLAVARASEELGFDAFFRSDHYMLIDERRSDAPGRPTPGSRWRRSGARRRRSGSARWSRRSRSAARVTLAIQVAQADAMSGGRVELGIGAGWYDGRARRVRDPLPRHRHALRDARGAARDPHRPVGHARRRALRLRRARHYRVVGFARRLPKPVQQPRPPIIVGGVRRQAHAPPRGDLRRRVQRAVHAARLLPARVPTSSAPRVEAAGRDPASLRYTFAAETCVGAATKPSSAGVRPRSAATPTSCARARASGTRRRGRRTPPRVRPPPARRRPTSRSSTSTTSTSSN